MDPVPWPARQPERMPDRQPATRSWYPDYPARYDQPAGAARSRGLRRLSKLTWREVPAAGQPDRLHRPRHVCRAAAAGDHRTRPVGYPILASADVPRHLLDHARRAVHACPTLALLMD